MYDAPHDHVSHTVTVRNKPALSLLPAAGGKYETSCAVTQRAGMRELPNRPSDTEVKYHDLLWGSVSRLKLRHAGRALAQSSVFWSQKPPAGSSHKTAGWNLCALHTALMCLPCSLTATGCLCKTNMRVCTRARTHTYSNL